jgi:hypothetical protein
MATPTEITVKQLACLVGLPGAPAIAHTRKEEKFTSHPRLVPTANAILGAIEWWRRYTGLVPLAAEMLARIKAHR